MNEESKEVIMKSLFSALLQEHPEWAEAAGWTPPQEKWVPEEGELVQYLGHLDDKKYPAYYSHSMHRNARDIKPHPTHIKWEEGATPSTATAVRIGQVWESCSKKIGTWVSMDDGRWFWLEED